MNLSQIAQVMIGVLAKRENKEDGNNCYKLFSLKSYEEKQEYDSLKTNKDFFEKVARKGDLLFRLLYPNKVVYVDEEIEGMLIPSQYCIIRLQEKKMDPIVLKWYLENKTTRKELELRLTGSVIKSMTLENLKNLNVPIVSIEKQKYMKELILLWNQEKQITNDILNEKEKLYNYYLEEMIKKGE